MKGKEKMEEREKEEERKEGREETEPTGQWNGIKCYSDQEGCRRSVVHKTTTQTQLFCAHGSGFQIFYAFETPRKCVPS